MAREIYRKMLLVLVMLAAVLSLGAQTSDRYALVIGNSNYIDLGALKNTRNDAEDVSAVLKGLGFEVITLLDADLVQTENAVVALSNKLSNAPNAVGLFYYAGHGVQSGGMNYLIPVDARIPSEAFLRTKALSVQSVLDNLQAAHNSLNIVILDACRNNPFSWARDSTRGLSVVSAQPPGSIIVYATSAGSVALDGMGRNGVFTAELLKNLAIPGLDVMELFLRTGQGVQHATKGLQNPAIFSQYFEKTYLTGEPSIVSAQNISIMPSSESSQTASKTPSLVIEKHYGTVRITVATAGTLALDGQEMGVLVPNTTAALKNLDVGIHELRMDYGAGDYEIKTVSVENASETPVTFERKKLELTIPGSSVQIRMNLINAGKFLMGSSEIAGSQYKDEAPQHEVVISKPFYIGATEVTQAQWLAVMGSNPSAYFMNQDAPFLPVDSVSWEDCQKFIAKINTMGIGKFRLPTEAEWEYACRAGTQTLFPWGDDPNLMLQHASYYFSGDWSPAIAASRKPNAWGIYDMIGNVLEWCADWYGPYSKGSPSDPKGAKSGSYRVLRGGDWATAEAKDLRSARRYYEKPSFSSTSIGFRLAREYP